MLFRGSLVPGYQHKMVWCSHLECRYETVLHCPLSDAILKLVRRKKLWIFKALDGLGTYRLWTYTGTR